MHPFEYIQAADQKAALLAVDKKHPGTQFIAGGTNLLDLMKKGVAAPARLVDISRLPLRDIALQDGALHIGALALNSDVAAHPLVQKHAPLLARALLAGASPQIRNMATVGGNLLQRTRCPYFYDTAMPCNKRLPGSGCSALEGYHRAHAIFGASGHCIAVHPSDMAVALVALRARVELVRAKKTWNLAVSDLHRLPGETPEQDVNLSPDTLIAGISVPESPYTRHIYYLKVRDRASYAFALVSVAAALELDGNTIRSAGLALGGVAHKPWALPEVEQFLAGKTASEAVFRQAGELAVQTAQPLRDNAFKVRLTAQSVALALKKAGDFSF